jgi:uncharacterized damage-inducible protein DinB
MDTTTPVGFIKDLFEYNRECNRAVAQTMQQHKAVLSDKSIRWLSHILNSHHIWNCKIKNELPTVSPWTVRELSKIDQDDTQNFSDSLDIINRYSLHQSVTYSISGIGSFSNNILEIFFQVINHSTYHRGQLALEFRTIGIEPLLTEYIVYKMKTGTTSA